MPCYIYTAKDSNGRAISNTADAASEDSLVDKLQREGYFVLSVQPAEVKVRSTSKKKIATDQVKFTHAGIKLDDILVFARQLATMLGSGVTLLRSLDVILSQVESRELARVLTKVRDDIEQGRSLSQSLAKHPKVFNQFWVSLVEVGEASGTMPLVLEKLAFYMEQQAAFRSAIISSLVYPGILFFVCMGAVAFFALYVAPRFEKIFVTMKLKLPLITQMLLAYFKFVKMNIVPVIGGIVVFIFLLKKYIRTYQGGLQFEKVLFSLPIFGNVVKLIIVERFASQMSILVDSGVPILYALEITERLVENRTCALVVADIREAVRQGRLLAEPMQQSGFFPPMAVQMIKVGEETGELSKMLKHVSDFYQKNVEAFMKRFGTMIEPVMLVVMGGVIGTIVIAMFLPILDLSTGGGGG